MGVSVTCILILLLSPAYPFSTEYSVLRESTAQGVAPHTLSVTSPHPFQEQIGRPSAEMDRRVTPVPLRARRY